MESKIKKIAENSINNYKFDKTFITLSSDRVFEIIEINNFKYLLGWQSDLLEPKILNIEEKKLIVIGIDQKLIIIDYYLNETIIENNLDYLFLEFYLRDKCLIVATELELVIINISTWKSYNEFLPDNFESLVFNYDNILIKCTDNTVIEINNPVG